MKIQFSLNFTDLFPDIFYPHQLGSPIPQVCFAKQPQHLRKVHASWARLAETPDITLETVRSTILPLLRGNSFLVESFLGLFPSEQPPEW